MFMNFIRDPKAWALVIGSIILVFMTYRALRRYLTSHKVTIYLRGGQVLRLRMKEFTVSTTGADITGLKWATMPGDPRLMDLKLSDISAVVLER